jgi:branched-subunit amino acid transport protein AzlD
MNDNEMKAQAAQTITDEPLKEVTIPVWEYTFWDRLNKRPKERTFKIYRIRTCNMYRCADIAHRLPQLEGEITTVQELNAITFPLVRNHKDDFVRLIACCIQNNHKEPRRSLINFLDRNLTADMMFDLVITCLNQIGLQSFFSTAILIKGISAIVARDEAVTNAETLE